MLKHMTQYIVVPKSEDKRKRFKKCQFLKKDKICPHGKPVEWTRQKSSQPRHDWLTSIENGEHEDVIRLTLFQAWVGCTGWKWPWAFEVWLRLKPFLHEDQFHDNAHIDIAHDIAVVVILLYHLFLPMCLFSSTNMLPLSQVRAVLFAKFVYVYIVLCLYLLCLYMLCQRSWPAPQGRLQSSLCAEHSEQLHPSSQQCGVLECPSKKTCSISTI